MTYGAYLTLDQDVIYRDDFSSANDITGTIWTDINESTARDITLFTVTIRMHRPNRRTDLFAFEAAKVVAANGTWRIFLTEGSLPPPGLYQVVAQLTGSGVRETTLNRQIVHIIEGPTS